MKLIEVDFLELCTNLGLDDKKVFKKRLLVSIVGLFIAVLMAIVYNVYFGAFILLVSLILYKYEYFSLKGRWSQIIIQRQISFVNFFSYLLVFLENRLNLYQAIKSTEEYLDNDIHSLVEELIENINSDKTTIPYIKFAQYFSSEIVMQIMLLLHQFEQSGYSDEQLKRFSITLAKMKENTVDDYIAKTNSQLDLFTIIPVISSIIIITFFAIGILDSIGGVL